MNKLLAITTLVSASYAALAQENAELAGILQAIDTSQCGHLAVSWVNGEQSGKVVLSNDAAVGTGSLYEIGSITKGITGIALAQAILDDQISLSDDVFSLLPFENKEKLEYLRNVTLEDLATHTSGFPRVPNMGLLYAMRNRNDPYAPFDVAALETALARTKLWQQGSPNYSNFGFGLLGYLVANAQQKDYGSFVEQSVLAPLGMESSRTYYSSLEGADFAPAFTKNCKKGHRWTMTEPTAAAGAIKSNLDDMSFLLEAVLHPEQSALADATELATEPRRRFDDKTRIGFGWLSQTEGDKTVLWHNGGTGSFASFIGVNRAQERAVVLLFNKPMYDEVTKAELDYLTAEFQPEPKVPARKSMTNFTRCFKARLPKGRNGERRTPAQFLAPHC